MINVETLKYPKMQDYILHYNCAYADKVTKNIQDVFDFINSYPNTQIEIKKERNFYGLTDYRFILTE